MTIFKKAFFFFLVHLEVEWEYVFRAGTSSKWSFGDDEKELEEYAWYSKNSNGITHSVGEEKGKRKSI